MRPARAVGAWVAAIALLAAGAGGALVLHGPDERIVEPVPASVLTATVTSRVLTTTLTGTGTLTAGGRVRLAVAAPDGTDAVVTVTPAAPGATVPWCTPAIEVSGRPVLVLPGAVPGYRDLALGDSGADVTQLQRALTACGVRVPADGAFGPATAAAVARLYERAGYRAPSAGLDTKPVDEAELEPADATLTTAPTPAPAARVTARGELWFAPDPVRVLAVAPVGTRLADGPALTLAAGADTFTATLGAAQRAALTGPATLTLTAGDWSVQVPLPPVADQPVNVDGAPAYPVTAELPEPVPPALLDGVVDFTITVGDGAPYDLVVPATALSQGVDGPGVDLAGGARVPVQVLAVVDGWVAIWPTAGTLNAGQEVIVGVR